MNAKQLRGSLLKMLSEDIGKYKNGVPSIWVYGSGTNPPSSSDGLEVLIKNVPGGNPENMSGGVRFHDQMWELTFKNWKPTSRLLSAVNRVQANFNTRRFRHYPASEKILEQAKIEISDPIVLPPRQILPDLRLPEVTDETEWNY